MHEEQIDNNAAENRRENKDPEPVVPIHFRHLLQQEDEAAEKYENVNGVEARKHFPQQLDPTTDRIVPASI